MPTELDRLGIEVTVDKARSRVVVAVGDLEAFMPPAAALELAERLREVATPLLPQPERCPVVARDGTRCLGDLGHERSHWTAAGWFSAEGDVERAR